MEEQILDERTDYGTFQAEPEYAGFWIRFVASLIDFLVFLPLTILLFYNMIKLKSLPLQVAIIVITAIYKPVMEAIYGATLGKMALKIKVLTKDLGKIDGFQAFVRYIPWLLGNVISLFTAAILFANGQFVEDTTMMSMQVQSEVVPQWMGFISSGVLLFAGISIIFNRSKRGIHDLMAGSVCIKTQPQD